MASFPWLLQGHGDTWSILCTWSICPDRSTIFHRAFSIISSFPRFISILYGGVSGCMETLCQGSGCHSPSFTIIVTKYCHHMTLGDGICWGHYYKCCRCCWPTTRVERSWVIWNVCVCITNCLGFRHLIRSLLTTEHWKYIKRHSVEMVREDVLGFSPWPNVIFMWSRGWCHCIDLNVLDKFISKIKFHVERPRMVLEAIQPRDWMLSMDLKNTCFKIPFYSSWNHQSDGSCHGLSFIFVYQDNCGEQVGKLFRWTELPN